MSFLFLGLTLHAGQWLAIIIVIIANIAVSVNIKNWRQSHLLKKESGIPFALVAAFGWGLFFFFLIPISKTFGPWLAALLVEIGVTVAAGVHLKLSSQAFHIKNALLPAMIKNGALICIGTGAFTLGVAHFNIGIITALSNSTALVTCLLGIVMFQEKLHPKERWAALAMISGIIALSVL